MRQSQGESHNHDSELQVPEPLPKWDNDRKRFDMSMNCLGVVYVRLIAAQRLPCPVGSSVCASVSLLPWQGKVKTERVLAFLPSSSSFDHGVCVTWDQFSDQGICSMVNAWSSDDSPVPSIRLDLSFSPLGIGIFEFTMCTLDVDCMVIMKTPNIWKRQWFQAKMTDSDTEDSTKLASVLINLEAMFAPGPDKPDPLPPPGNVELLDSNVEIVSDSDNENEENETIPEVTVDEMSTHSSEKSSRSKTRVIDWDDKSHASAVTHFLSNKHDPHLLKLVSFWVPKSCAVCSKILLGRKRGFHCEECSIECCGDCRLHIDLRLPCGSDAALNAVENSHKMSVNNLLSVVAPDESFHQNKEVQSETKTIVTERDSVDFPSGIGRIKLKFIGATLLKKMLPSETDPSVVFGTEKSTQHVRIGDYYARVSVSGSPKTGRTPTIQNTGVPKFGSEMNFVVEDYGREFRIDIVDAIAETTYGTTVLTTQGLLQIQRDSIIRQRGLSLFQCFQGPLQFKGEQMLGLELRAPNPSGFFATPGSKNEGQKESLDGIVGWIEVSAGIEENLKKMYTTGYECPSRPPSPFNVYNFQQELKRVKSLVDDFMSLVEDIKYIMSWKNPLVTSLAIYVFVAVCLRFDAEYCGSLPLLFLLLWMLRFLFTRKDGARRKKFVRQEILTRRKTEGRYLNYILHRPIGTIRLMTARGSRILSRDGLPGKVSLKVHFDPLRYANEKAKKRIVKIDRASDSPREIGRTNSCYVTDPQWELHESTESKRLKQLLPLEENYFNCDRTTSNNLRFPILQPISIKSQRKDNEGRFLDAVLEEFEDSQAALVFQVLFSDFLLGLGLEYALGEVVIPFSDLVQKRRISRWFDVVDETGTAVFTSAADGTMVDSHGKDNDCEMAESASIPTGPRLFLSMEWNPPADRSNASPDDREKELAYVIQEELIRSSMLKKQDKFDLVGSLNTALGIGGNLQDVQNKLSSALDLVESILNLFSFADPFKSSVLFLFLLVIWFLFMLIPSRFIVLSVGLVQFFLAFDHQYGIVEKLSNKTSNGTHVSSPDIIEEDESQAALAIWLVNALRSLPTSEDLRKLYFWESFRVAYKESEKYAFQKRESRLKRLWKAHWSSIIKLWECGHDENESTWQSVFAVVQGHHFLWWKSVRDFDNGEAPIGNLYLTGHAGLSTPSPLEAREFSSDELALLVILFGRGLNDQQRIAFTVPDEISKEKLENTILSLTSKDD